MKKIYSWGLAVVLLLGLGLFIFREKPAQKTVLEEIQPSRGDLEVLITTTGVVEPQNRLEVKPPINGRVEEILVQEGDQVKKGDVLAWMSSTERAALLDAASPKGEETLRYWQDAYKPTPLIASIDGQVIVRAVEPGQTVTSAEAVIVLSDRLIVKAQVDETDIGRVKKGQAAYISLDAYPKDNVVATVDHISYESKSVNNVTIYEVDILPESVPAVFRSGMTANVNIVEASRQDVLRIPVEAIVRRDDKTFVMVKEGYKPAQPKEVQTGLADEKYIEITSGLEDEDIVVMEKAAMTLPKKSSSGSNPFMPTPQRRRS